MDSIYMKECLDSITAEQYLLEEATLTKVGGCGEQRPGRSGNKRITSNQYGLESDILNSQTESDQFKGKKGF